MGANYTEQSKVFRHGTPFEIEQILKPTNGFGTCSNVMKKALLFALAGLFAAVAPALAYPPAPANVNFVSERGVPFGLVLDGRPLTRGVARQVHVDQLMPGQHWADFTLPTAYGGAIRFRTRVWLEPGLETSFVLIARPGRPLGLRQVDAVALYGPNQEQGYGNDYNDNNYGDGRFNSPAPYNQGGYGSNAPYNGNSGNPNTGYNSNGNSSAPGANTGNGYGNNSAGGANGYDNTPDDTGYYPGSAVSSYRTMQSQDVDGLVQAIRERPFDTNKLRIAKEALNQRSIQADDLKQLMQGLEFEASRVELAKFAYPHVTDRQHFYRVYQAFNFEASKREVEQAVASPPQN